MVKKDVAATDLGEELVWLRPGQVAKPRVGDRPVLGVAQLGPTLDVELEEVGQSNLAVVVFFCSALIAI